MSSPSPPMPASSWASWKSPMSISSTASLPPYPSNRKPRTGTPAQPWGPSPRSTTTSASFSRASACPTVHMCGRMISSQSVDQIVEALMTSTATDTKIQVLAPVVRGRKGEHLDRLDSARKNGFVRVASNGQVMSLDDEIKLDKNKKHSIDIVVDRLVQKGRHPVAPGRFRRDGHGDRRGAGHRPHRREERIFSTTLSCTRLRHLLPGALAPHVFLQQPLRRLPQMQRPGVHHAVRSRQDRVGPRKVAERGRPGGLGKDHQLLVHGADTVPGEELSGSTPARRGRTSRTTSGRSSSTVRARAPWTST